MSSSESDRKCLLPIAKLQGSSIKAKVYSKQKLNRLHTLRTLNSKVLKLIVIPLKKMRLLQNAKGGTYKKNKTKTANGVSSCIPPPPPPNPSPQSRLLAVKRDTISTLFSSVHSLTPSSKHLFNITLIISVASSWSRLPLLLSTTCAKVKLNYSTLKLYISSFVMALCTDLFTLYVSFLQSWSSDPVFGYWSRYVHALCVCVLL